MDNLILSPIGLNDLQVLISDSVQRALKEHQHSLFTPETEIISGEVLQCRLGVTRQTLFVWRRKGKIPYLQFGGNIRYDWHAVLKALEAKKKGV